MSNPALQVRKSVLVVDDEADAREVLMEYLKESIPNLLVIQADNGVDAMTKINLQKFDLVITDVRMPRMDGLALIRAAKSMLPEMKRPVNYILLSGAAESLEGLGDRRSREIGNVTFLHKPFTPTEMVTVVSNLLSPEIRKQKAAEQERVDVSFITPFIEAVVQVLHTTAQVDVVRESVFIRKSDELSGDISAIVAMNSNDYLGSMAISFDDKSFLQVVSSMLGETFTEITPDIRDAAAEICNQVFGVAKQRLNEVGHSIQLAIPSVIYGHGHTIRHSANGSCIAVKFKGPNGVRLVVEAVVQKRSGVRPG
jgi:chemotaxis protein CheX